MEEELTPEEIKEERDKVTAEIWGTEPTNTSPVAKDPKEPEVPKEEEEPEVIEEKEIDDPWAGVSPALREEIESLRKRVSETDALEERLKQTESRIGGITNKLHEAEKAEKVAKESAPTQEEIDAAAKTEEAWADLKDEYPVWSDGLEKILAGERTKFEKSLKTIEGMKETISTLQEQSKSTGNSEETDKKLSRLREELMVEVHHPGWENTVKSKEYGEWFVTQPADIQAKAESVQSIDAIEVLNSFEKHRKNGGRTPAQIEEARKKRLTKSELPSGHQRTPVVSDDDLSDAEYRKKLAADIWPNIRR